MSRVDVIRDRLDPQEVYRRDEEKLNLSIMRVQSKTPVA